MGIFEQIFSIVGGIVFAIVLTWFPGRMMNAAYVICIGSIVVLGYFYYADTIADKVQLIIATSSIGFFLIPTYTVAYELAVA